MTCKPFAWNGPSFLVPDKCEPVVLLRDYVRLSLDGEPFLDLKWQRAARGATAAKTLRRLGRGRSGVGFSPAPDAGPWPSPAAGLEVTPLVWEEGAARGPAALVYCHDCRTMSLFRFLGRAGRDETLPAALLASFLDHEDRPGRRYAVFDISLRAPGGCVLEHSSFLPGLFELRFRGPRRSSLRFLRLAPADVVLRRQEEPGLPGLARQLLGPCETARLAYRGEEALEALAGRPPLFGCLGADRRKRLRLWHLARLNRILGVEAAGALEPALFTEACDAYEVG